MKQHNHVIVGVHVTDRLAHAGAVQQVLTAYGRHIKTRLGLHDATGKASAPNGIILLEMVGEEAKCSAIIRDLNRVKGIEAKKMVFAHD